MRDGVVGTDSGPVWPVLRGNNPTGTSRKPDGTSRAWQLVHARLLAQRAWGIKLTYTVGVWYNYI
jgi:hypothetical protein